MKITTWNVNGLRAMLNKNGWEWVREYSPDVVCLQEIKARPEQLTEAQLALFEGYTSYWNPAERPGYSGVALFLKSDAPSKNGLGIDRFDGEGRVIQTAFDDFTLFNIYFPNGSRDHSRVPFKLDFYAALLEICDQMHARGEKVVICGDINTAHEEIDLKNHKTNHNTTGFLPEERAWITKYLDNGFVDAFRARYPDKEQYTWWSYMGNARANNVGWRLDYFMVSEDLMPRVADVIIHDEVRGSDHCPVTMILK
ncbi:MAG: exodeoxyribonuclease III [Anaerolineales bacterium]|nr:exodeoxyribonuclease III [Anaerolineales bacterium]